MSGKSRSYFVDARYVFGRDGGAGLYFEVFERSMSSRGGFDCPSESSAQTGTSVYKDGLDWYRGGI